MLNKNGIYYSYNRVEEFYTCFDAAGNQNKDEAFEKCTESAQGEFVVHAGTAQNDFSFALKLGEKCRPLKETEIRLYKTNANDAGKLVFKNYNGSHKNLLYGLEIRK